MALVSAIVPIYNPRPDHLDEALGSILSQETDIEAIVVNDGSTERSFDNVMEKHGSIVFIEQKNTGVAGARNAGLFAASGEYVAFLDQDDRWRPGKLRKQLAVFKNNPEAGVVFHPVNYIDGDGKPRKANPASERRLRRRRLSKDTLGALLEGNFIFSPTVLARKSCFEKTGGFDSTVDPHDDWDMWLRLAMAGFQFVNIEEPLADWRIHPGNTSGDKSRMLRTRIAVVDKLERGGALPDHLHRALVRARAECHVTLAHSLYKEKRYDGFREEIRAAAGVDWKAAAKFKILRRWLRSVILGRAGA
jgi:glycosyltransferase involved in cell wall biosynthesis